MRNINGALLAVAACLFLLGMATMAFAHDHSTSGAAQSGTKYACPMGCKVMDHPGKCPVCGMQMSALPDSDNDDDDDAPAAAYSGDPYYLSVSPTGRPLGDKPIVTSYEGRELRFADAADQATFNKNPEKYLSLTDQKMVADQLPYYALKVCPITGEELSEPVNYIFNNRLVRFCCAGCIEEFTSNPDKYIGQLDDAESDAQMANYPLDHCIVLTDEKPDGKHDVVIASRLFRFCCGDCEKKVKASPAKWIGELDSARKHS